MSKPVPIEVKRKRDTVHSTRERRNQEPEFPAVMEIPYPPAHLDEGAKELWQRVSMQLGSVGLMFPSCFEYLDTYCRAWMIRERAWKRIEEHGDFLVNHKGEEIINPAFKIYQITTDQMIVVGAKLGISPADKTKVSKGAFEGRNTDKNSQKKISVRG